MLEKAEWWVSEGGPQSSVVYRDSPSRETWKMEARVRGGEKNSWRVGMRDWGWESHPWGAEGSRGAEGKWKKQRFLVAPLADLWLLCRFHIHIHILGYLPTPSKRNVLSKAEKRIVHLSKTCLWTFLMHVCVGIPTWPNHLQKKKQPPTKKKVLYS